MGLGREFQRVGAAMEKALSPQGFVLRSGAVGIGGWHWQSEMCGWECDDGGAQTGTVVSGY